MRINRRWRRIGKGEDEKKWEKMREDEKMKRGGGGGRGAEKDKVPCYFYLPQTQAQAWHT
jgi:hypothetical protein